MILENIYYIGQTIAVVAIVATLLALLWQGRQTNRIARADLTLNLWVEAGAANYALMDSPEKAEFMQRALFGATPLSDAEKTRFGNLMGYVVGMYEGAFMLSKRGLIESAAYERSSGLVRLYFESARVRKWWKTRREYGYDPGFREIIDALAGVYETADVDPKNESKDDARRHQ